MQTASLLKTAAFYLFAILLAGNSFLSAKLVEGENGSVSSAAGLEMIWVDPGSFTMGSPSSEFSRRDDESQHTQTLTNGFWLGKYEVTQAQWREVMTTDPSHFTGDNLPVEQVSWEEAQAFCVKVNQLENGARNLPAGYSYQLPSEAQWEYACRAGTKTSHAGQPPSDYAWFFTNSRGQSHYVGLKTANRWGFHDMHGNVQEWCLDWYGPYSTGDVTDSKGPGSGNAKVMRGGNWHYYPDYTRSADRRRAVPAFKSSSVGLRLCLSKPLMTIDPVTVAPVFGEDVTVLTDLEMIWVEPGTFTMGSPVSEPNRRSDETQHEVTLTKGFWLGKYEVTQAQWREVMGTSPSYFTGDNLPVEKVSWGDAMSFCAKFTEQESGAARLPAGYIYSLPTEAQWEYACRAGTKTATAYGDSLSSTQANFKGNSPYNGGVSGPNLGKTTNVGSYTANAWGFHDMHGNVYEWCHDRYGDYSDSATDPVGPISGTYRVARGGNWYYGGELCRSATRGRRILGSRNDGLGFRLSLRSVPVDSTQPVVTLTGDSAMDWELGKSFVEPGYTATDDVDGDLSSKVEVTGTVDVQTTGSYTLTYTVTDAAGNTGTVQRVVTVVAGNGTGEDFTVLTDLEMIWVEPGTFMMGSPVSEPNRSSNEMQHEVTLTKGFWLGKYEVTQAQWREVMGTSPSHFTGDNLPVEEVSWTEAISFCAKLTEQESGAARLPAGYIYSLPTEAQWEYACRAGTTTATAYGNTLSSTQANFRGTNPYNGGATGPYLGKTTNVGSYAANAWGFHDMHGNVYEWCHDWYGHYSSATDPVGPISGTARVARGGSWGGSGGDCRSANRNGLSPGLRHNYLGFRLSLRSE